MLNLEDLATTAENFRTTEVEIGDLHPEWVEVSVPSGTPTRRLTSVSHGGERWRATPRFCKSLGARLGLGDSVYRYFTPAEVFARAQEVRPNMKLRLTLEGNVALGVSDPHLGHVDIATLADILDGQGERVLTVDYRNGVVTSTHGLDVAARNVFGESFDSAFTLETPIDGVGSPRSYVSAIRQVCVNGLIAHAKIFRCDIQLGDSPHLALERALDSLQDTEAHECVYERLVAARTTQASMAETTGLHNAVVHATEDSGTDRPRDLLAAIKSVAGDPAEIFGLSNVNSLSVKKQRLLGMRCSVLDLVNLATEIGTHHSTRLSDATRLHAWVGSRISQEFDLEGVTKFESEPKAFYLKN